MNDFSQILLSRLREALTSANAHKGSLPYAEIFAKAACAFNAFLNLLPDLNLEQVEKQEIVCRLQKISNEARAVQLSDFALWIDDVSDELLDKRQRRLRNHW